MNAIRIALLALVAPTFACRRNTPEPPTGTLVVELPFAAGHDAQCAQGALSTGTHRDIYAWDFTIAEGTPIVAVAPGWVIQVIDDRTTTGRNEYNESNRIIVDIGDGLYASYLHHRAFTARVKPGDEVHTGTHLANVGNVGTIVPHIHFDVRSASGTKDVWFRTATNTTGTAAEQGRRYTSGTRSRDDRARSPSRLTGKEFSVNGVDLEPPEGALSFTLPTAQPIVLHGRVTRPARSVGFYLWTDGVTSDHVATAQPDSEGRFTIITTIPTSISGPRWLRMAITDPAGHQPNTATLPVHVAK